MEENSHRFPAIEEDYGRLSLTLDFKAGTTRQRLIEILSDALYRPDVALSESMPIDSEDQDWFGLNKEARFHYSVEPIDLSEEEHDDPDNV